MSESKTDWRRYPLTTVVPVAAVLFSRVRPDQRDPESARQAAKEAIMLLAACESACREAIEQEFYDRYVGETRDRLEEADRAEFGKLSAKYPSGVPFVTAVRHITESGSESKAMMPFKQFWEWRRQGYEEKIPDAPTAVAGFRRDKLPPGWVVSLRREFLAWKDEHIPRVRRMAGQQGQATRRKLAAAK